MYTKPKPPKSRHNGKFSYYYFISQPKSRVSKWKSISPKIKLKIWSEKQLQFPDEEIQKKERESKNSSNWIWQTQNYWLIIETHRFEIKAHTNSVLIW